MIQGKRTKIVCTMGPATEDEGVLRSLIESVMTVARFNFSHGSREYHKAGIERVRKVAGELGVPIAIMLDTKGPEIRTGLLEGGAPVTLHEGDLVTVTTEQVTGTASRFSISYEGLPGELVEGSTILVDDGLIALMVDVIDGHDIHCIVLSGGELGERKGVNVPGAHLGLPAVTKQDEEDIAFGCQMGVDAIAASFIRDAEGVRRIRELCADGCREDILILPKIECAEGIENFDEILAEADGIMVARGDLGVEVPAQEVPHLQKDMIRKCNVAYKPVITATQMLDSMIRNPRPTRAEVADVANAIYDGTDCVMLSGETASGHWPVESVRTMASICVETERYLEERHDYPDRGNVRNVNGAIGYAAVSTAERVGATCIVAPSMTGRTARLMSAFRPRLPIVAFSPIDDTRRKCCLYWGVECYPSTLMPSMEATVRSALSLTKEHGIAAQGDLAIVTVGDPRTSPTQGEYVTSTNVLMVCQVG
ncbi:MAG: pyruvate kinase [Atopobiaceae bacterium]|nr:pyruvate kinase [Atopobiaceae bacterium]